MLPRVYDVAIPMIRHNVLTNTLGYMSVHRDILTKTGYKGRTDTILCMANNGKEKVHLTIKPETAEWLRSRYPDSDSLPEAVRAAIGDARKFWELVEVTVDKD